MFCVNLNTVMSKQEGTYRKHCLLQKLYEAQVVRKLLHTEAKEMSLRLTAINFKLVELIWLGRQPLQ